MTPTLKELIQKSAELLERAGEVEVLNGKLAAENDELKKKASIAEKTEACFEKLANELIAKGNLQENSKVAFISMLRENPEQIIEVAKKVADLDSVVDFGVPAVPYQKEASEKLDPIARFAFGV